MKTKLLTEIGDARYSYGPFGRTIGTYKWRISLKFYDILTSLINIIRTRFHHDHSKLVFGERCYEIYESAIETCLKLNNAVNDKTLLDKAFFYSEKGKYAVLLDALVDRKAKYISGIPDSLLATEMTLKETITATQNRLVSPIFRTLRKKPGKAVIFQSLLIDLHTIHEKFIKKLEEDYPIYGEKKYQLNIIKKEEIQKILKPKKEVYIEYFYGNRLYVIFVITHNSFHVLNLDYPMLLDKDIDETRYGVIELNSEIFSFATQRVYNTLVTPIEKFIQDKKVFIVPDGKISIIPFEIFITPKYDAEFFYGYNKLPYFIVNTPLSYGFSGTILFRDFSSPNQILKNAAISFAPMATSDDSSN